VDGLVDVALFAAELAAVIADAETLDAVQGAGW